MQTISCFCDETGAENMGAGYHLISLVLHDQSHVLDPFIDQYLLRLHAQGLADVPFHMVDLLHGHGDYSNMTQEARKRLLVAFGTFVRTLPFSYRSFRYTGFDTKDSTQLSTRINRDIAQFLEENLSFFQSFDKVVIYYDGGQKAVASGLRQAFHAKLASNIAQHQAPTYQEKRLAQVADYLCSIEHASDRYDRKAVSSTYLKFFGTRKAFRGNYLKQIRRKAI